MTGFPGDALIGDPLVVVDRHATFGVRPESVWPWLVQIGKGRGGWYMPAWVERFVPRGRRGLRRVEPTFQDVQVGMEEPDWGPGSPVFRCAGVDRPRSLVWHTLRDTGAGHRWPTDASAPSVIALSWALLLSEDAAGGTHLHIRLRMDKPAWRADRWFRFKAPIFDFFDWLTIVLLFAGLRERVGTPRD